MKKFYCVLSLLVACHPNQNKPVDLDKLKFDTTDASELYFKNIRQSSYRMQALDSIGVNIFSLKKGASSELTCSLLHNWRVDRAFIRLTSSSDTIWVFDDSQLIAQIATVDLTFSEQTRHSLIIYNAILADHQFFKDPLPIHELVFDKESFRTSCFDYLRLTELR